METYENENKYLRAKHRVADIKKFYTSLMSYLIIIPAFAGLNYYLNEWSHPWFLWAAFGWGIGLFFQSLKAFRWISFFGKDWEEKKMRRFMEEEESKNKL